MVEKIRYSDKELAEFEVLIDAKIEKASAELAYYMKQIQDLADADGTKLKSLGDATGNLESERLQTMAARQNKLIKHLDNSKMRIKNKVYGICRVSGELISKERLKAVPHATMSIKAKQNQPNKVKK